MTEDTTDTTRRLRCALFVDFDNVYIGLSQLDKASAEAFAESPGNWLNALENGRDDDGDFSRRFLIRACYLNPSVYSRYRPFFTRAGFTVIDCPSLTQQGKSSADINLVLDAVDALNAPTNYDEFMIFSADADFTPLALRCRAADRRVTIVTASAAASAYRNVADTVISADELADLVKPPQLAAAPETAATVADPTPEPTGRVQQPASTPGPTAQGTSSQASGKAPATKRSPATSKVPAAKAPAVKAPPNQPSSPARRVVLRLVRSAQGPLVGSTVAQAAMNADQSLPGTNWQGCGSFFNWLAVKVPELGAASRPTPGFVWDKQRYSESDLPVPGGVDLPPLQLQVAKVTDVPNLTAARYKVLLATLADDVSTNPFDRADTSRRVRDACQAAGQPIGRASVNTVIAGILLAGLDLTKPASAQQLAQTWADNVIGLCRGARMELSAADVAAIRAWVGGGLLGR